MILSPQYFLDMLNYFISEAEMHVKCNPEADGPAEENLVDGMDTFVETGKPNDKHKSHCHEEGDVIEGLRPLGPVGRMIKVKEDEEVESGRPQSMATRVAVLCRTSIDVDCWWRCQHVWPRF
jgi:hypothetical protein